MPDEVDQAQEVIEATLQRAVTVARSRPTSKPSRFDCLDCEEPISSARRTAVPGCTRCVVCQKEFETITGNWRAL